MSTKHFLHTHSTLHLMRFRVAYGPHRRKHKHIANPLVVQSPLRAHSHPLTWASLRRKLSKSSLLLRIITARPWLSNWPPSTRLQQSLIDSGWTVSGFPSSNAGCECFSFVLLFEQLSAPASFSASNNVSGSRQSPWLVLLLARALKALRCHLFWGAWAKIRPAQSIGMPPVDSFAGQFCGVNFWWGSITRRYAVTAGSILCVWNCEMFTQFCLRKGNGSLFGSGADESIT